MKNIIKFKCDENCLNCKKLDYEITKKQIFQNIFSDRWFFIIFLFCFSFCFSFFLNCSDELKIKSS